MFFDTRFSSARQSEKSGFAIALLRWLGVRLIAVPNGLDVVFLNECASRFGFFERLQKDYPDWDLQEDAVQIRRYEDPALEDFWPVPVFYLMPAISRALEIKACGS